MTLDRIGTVLMLVASAWLVMLITTESGVYAEPAYRQRVGISAAVILATAFFPRHLYLSGTVLAFVSLGLAVHVGVFGLFGMELQGLVPAVVLALSMWFRRVRLDLTDIVLVTSLVACGLAIVQPNVVFFALTIVAVVNLMIWLSNVLGSFRSTDRS